MLLRHVWLVRLNESSRREQTIPCYFCNLREKWSVSMTELVSELLFIGKFGVIGAWETVWAKCLVQNYNKNSFVSLDFCLLSPVSHTSASLVCFSL